MGYVPLVVSPGEPIYHELVTIWIQTLILMSSQ